MKILMSRKPIVNPLEGLLPLWKEGDDNIVHAADALMTDEQAAEKARRKLRGSLSEAEDLILRDWNMWLAFCAELYAVQDVEIDYMLDYEEHARRTPVGDPRRLIDWDTLTNQYALEA